MESFNIKIITCGIAILLFSVMVAILSQAKLCYIIAGLGLAFVFIGCFTRDDERKNQ